MNIQITGRTLIVYVVAIAVAWILTEVVWGATGGIVGGLTISRNPEYQQQTEAFLKARGIDLHGADVATVRAAYSKLTPEDQTELSKMSRNAMKNINWLLVTLFVSFVVFGGVGFLSGIIAKSWALAPLIPASSFLLNNPVIRFAMAKELPPYQKIIVVVVQFVVCAGLAFLGAKVVRGNKRGQHTSEDIVATRSESSR